MHLLAAVKSSNMNIYKHEGNGHYIGSVVVVTAENLSDAKELIEKYLIDNGLPNEELNIVEIPIVDCRIVYAQNGDY